MPTFTAIALDRLLEPGASRSVEKSAPSSMPVPGSKLGRRDTTPAARKKVPRPQIKPALYATPEVTPIPDLPPSSSFPPSPYIINHKRRGPRLLKSSSEANVQSQQKDADDEKVNGQLKISDTVIVSSAGDLQVTSSNPESVKEEHINGVHGSCSNVGDLENGHCETGSSIYINGSEKEINMLKAVAMDTERDGESDNFFDPQDSMSFASNTDGEDNTGTEPSVKYSTPAAEFYDAWEELSSEGGSGTQIFPHDVEAELRDMRLNLLMEIEKRKQAEESLHNMQSQWESIRQRLSLVGIFLPAELIYVAEGEELSSDPVEELCQQIYVARFVSDAIGKGTARADVELEMEAQLAAKNFEIARLLERLHFYETVNQEMSQRNQEAVELARRERQRRSRRQKWVWGSIATAIALGTAAIAWSYLPMGRGASSAEHDLALEHDDAAK